MSRVSGASLRAAALLAACAVGPLSACAPSSVATTVTPPVASSVQAPAQPLVEQPANVGDAKIAALDYYNSGRYLKDVGVVADAARAWVQEEAPGASKPAIVLDIDETSLSNWPMTKADDFGYFPKGSCDTLPAGPCGAEAWELSGRAKALPPMLALYQAARAANVAVFFVTGRREVERKSTTANLLNAGYRDFAALYLKPNAMKVASAADYKTPVRQSIEAQGYTIIANIGDQPSDLAGGHAEKTFLLPNPFYRVR
ncbi:HAD family acid phosphatase [Acetobacter sacchari]|uniref:HAD family acid phosphatase n=1 Tax=Acetobacter sacchari TaxID=2661687 RepID=UPI00311CA077